MIRILGIDPGSVRTGYGIIDNEENHSRHVAHGVIRLGTAALAERLRRVQEQLTQLFETYQPAEVGVEKVFMHKNADSALKLGQARGVAIAACAGRGMEVFEYTPNQVKQSVVGHGHAAKQQVQHMVKVLLCLSAAPPADAADALAIALCHAHSREGLLRMRGVSGVRGGRLR